MAAVVCLVGPQHGVRAGKTSPCLGAEPTLPRQPGGAGKPWETPGWIPQPGEVRTQGRERHYRCVRVWGTVVFKVGNNSSREDLNLPSTPTRLQDSTRRFGFAQEANKQQSLRAAVQSALILRPALAITELSARL